MNTTSNKKPKVDEYGVVLNSFETFEWIAFVLGQVGSVMVAWADEEGTQFDILFNRMTFPFLQFIGPVQGGLRGNDLFVSIMRLGAFGFDINHTDTHYTYFDEKLSGFRIGATTSKKLAELVNGVKRELVKLQDGKK